MPTKFDFLSPGIQLREIDESQVPETPENPGILLIGRARSGPAMKPIRVKTLNDFVEVFGNPIDGVRQDDPWRQGNTGAPNYAAYAAQAYLAAGVGPVKYVRLLGKSKDNAVTGNDAAGWYMGSSFGLAGADEIDYGATRVPSNAAAYGLFIVPSGSTETGQVAATLASAITVASATPTAGDTITINVPAGAGGVGSVIMYIVATNAAGNRASVYGASTVNDITVSLAGGSSAEEIRDRIADAVAGVANANVSYGTGLPEGVDIDFGSAAAKGLAYGLTAADVSTDAITLTANTAGSIGNTIALATSAPGNFTLAAATLSGGEDTLAAVTGTLAAILYSSGSAFGVSGSWVSASAATTSLSASTLMGGNAASYGVKLGLSSSATAVDYFDVNFTDYSNGNYIRNVLNTDPTKFFNNTNYGETDVSYFLGETFDVNVDRLSGNGAAASSYFFIAGLGVTGLANYDNFRQELTAAKSGWFIGAKPEQKYLFRLIALQDGEEFQNNYYCRIKNIRLATALQPRATFSLEIVKRGGTVLNDTTVESFTNLTLDPDSENYIVKRIGDISESWSPSEEKYILSGLYPNISDFVRIEMATNSSIVPSDVPMGFLGPVRPTTVTLESDTVLSATSGSSWIHGSSSIALGNNLNHGAADDSPMIAGWPTADSPGTHAHLTASIEWPKFGMTTQNSKLGSQDYPATANFGLRHVKSTSLVNDQSFADIARRRYNIDPDLAEGAAFANASFVFTLEDIVSSSAGATTYYWNSGSYELSTPTWSIAKRYGLDGANGLVDGKKIKQFAAPFFGGADGVDVRYADPFSNDRLDAGTTQYPYYSVEQAIEMVSDPEQVQFDLVAKPGLLKSALVTKIADMATTRGDALAVVDIKGIFQPKTDNGGTEQSANINTLTTQMNTNYLIDSSYACTYFPNVRIKDTLSGNGTILKAPPSLAGIGAIAQSEAQSQPWFAPAGFNRGGLSRLGGSTGPMVVGTTMHLTKDDRDVLYESNINPIARFPATGDTVVFGQKTLQQTQSALDRINVRRMMIYLKRKIGEIADTILFDQNVQATWLRFKSRAETVLSEIQAELGIVEYKLVLDETTTTPDLIDRNILYAKVYVKPARSIEFIAVDFIITRSGVEF